MPYNCGVTIQILLFSTTFLVEFIMNQTTIQAPSVFNSEILTCKFSHLIDDNDDDDYNTIIQHDFNYDSCNNHAIINVDCRDGEVTCFEQGSGLSANQADGSDRYFQMPQRADKQKTYDFLCNPKVIKLLETVYFGNEQGRNLNWYLDDDARAASNQLCFLIETADLVEYDDDEDDEDVDIKILSVTLHITAENTLQANANCLFDDKPAQWFTDNDLEFFTDIDSFGGTSC